MSPSPENEFILEQFIQSIQATSALIQHLSDQIKSNDVSLESLRGELTSIKENLEAISRIVRDGNGDKPLISRIDILEQNLQNIQHWIENQIAKETKDRESKEQAQADEKKVQDEKKWNMTVLIISSILGFLSSLIVVLVRMKVGQ